MQRTKLLAAIAAVAMLGGVALYALGTANAAEWHAYSGEVYPGHAYALQVPADARGLEMKLDGNGSAQLALYDPFGAKVGAYALDPSLPAADIASPQPGAYVLYVYTLHDGALRVAVDSAKSPDPQLGQVSLTREDITVASVDPPAALDKSLTAKFVHAPVFVTLLYDGSAQGLDAKVASAKGDVLTVAGESGTAFSPGVFTAQSGSRVATFSNYEGATYTATVHAKSFQGTMVLTGLSFQMPKPTPTATATSAPAPGMPASVAVVPGGAPVRLAEGHAYAFAAQPGTLLLQDARLAQGKASNGTYYNDAILVFTPQDKLLQSVELNGTNGGANTIQLPVAGEYIAFVERATNLAVYATVPGGDGATRELTLGHESFNFSAHALDALGNGAKQTFELKHVPVKMQLDGSDGITILGGADIRNEQGVVASWDSLADVGGLTLDGGYTATHPDLFAAGEHAFEAWQFTEGAVHLETTYYLRDAPIPAPALTSPNAPPAPPSPPSDPNNGTGNQTGNNTTWDPTQGIPLPLDGATLPNLGQPRIVAPRLI